MICKNIIKIKAIQETGMEMDPIPESPSFPYQLFKPTVKLV